MTYTLLLYAGHAKTACKAYSILAHYTQMKKFSQATSRPPQAHAVYHTASTGDWTTNKCKIGGIIQKPLQRQCPCNCVWVQNITS